MCSLLGKIFKSGIAVVTVLSVVGLGAFLVAGGPRSRAVVSQFQEHVNEAIDQHIDEPTKIRAQLREMEEAFPERIAGLRAELRKIEKDIQQVQKDKAIHEMAVSLAKRDLDELGPQVDALAAMDANDRVRLASVNFGDKTLSLERAQERLAHIREARDGHAQAAVDSDRQLLTYEQQREIVQDHLFKLENEYGALRREISLIENQIETIDRNEALIGQLEETKRMVEKYTDYEAVSLERLRERLAEVQLEQRSKLEVLTGEEGEELDYGKMARERLKSGEFPDVDTQEAEIDYELPSVIRSAANR